MVYVCISVQPTRISPYAQGYAIHCTRKKGERHSHNVNIDLQAMPYGSMQKALTSRENAKDGDKNRVSKGWNPNAVEMSKPSLA